MRRLHTVPEKTVGPRIANFLGVPFQDHPTEKD
jgi:hypothetical protein